MSDHKGVVPEQADHVDIIMSTYNGARYLRPQLGSLFEQTDQAWRLIVRDDGSQDDTPAILAEYKERHPTKVEVVVDNLGGIGAQRSFGAAMTASTAGFMLFCDQDDVWLPQKVQVLRARMNDLEGRVGRHTPILVHSDLVVVDADLRPLAPSFLTRLTAGRTDCHAFRRLLMENVVTGCATMVNRALVQRALPVPPEAWMHDWWLALVAAAFGVIDAVDEPLVLYRQHGRNTLGARRTFAGRVRRVVADPAALVQRSRQGLRRTAAQARAFVARHGDQMKPEDLRIAQAYGGLPDKSYGARRAAIVRNRFFLRDRLANAGLVLFA